MKVLCKMFILVLEGQNSRIFLILSSNDARGSLVHSILYLTLMLTVCVILGSHINSYSVSFSFNKYPLL